MNTNLESPKDIREPLQTETPPNGLTLPASRAHSPLPWEATTGKFAYGDFPCITSKGHNMVCTMHSQFEEGKANAAYITTACNAFPELLAALDELLKAEDNDTHVWAEELGREYRPTEIQTRLSALLARLRSNG